jgi:sulfatase modifying factor 1
MNELYKKKEVSKMRNSIILLLLILLSIYSCSEDSTNPSAKPHINEIVPNTAYVGQNITIYGENFGFGDINAKIIFDSTISINKIDCKKWNNSLIELIVPKGVVIGDVFVIVDQDTSNSLRMTINALPPFDIILVKGGSYKMGSDAGTVNEMPVHDVSIDSLYVSKYEVTQLLWKSVMGTIHEDYYGDDLPIANIGWDMAVEFCNELSKIEMLDTCYSFRDSDVLCDFEANGYRLPTEAEWEYLCRAGTTGDFNGTNINDIAWYAENSGFNRHPVGNKSPNAFGLYDMHGNLWEWCWDWYDENYYDVSPEDNPQGPLEGTKDVIRGGSYKDDIFYLRSANRTFPHYDSSLCGFRIVRKATK